MSMESEMAKCRNDVDRQLDLVKGSVEDEMVKRVVQCALFPREALEIVAKAKREVDHEFWQKPVSEYHSSLVVVFWIWVQRAAIEWLDENKPKHLARALFQDKSEAAPVVAEALASEPEKSEGDALTAFFFKNAGRHDGEGQRNYAWRRKDWKEDGVEDGDRYVVYEGLDGKGDVWAHLITHSPDDPLGTKGAFEMIGEVGKWLRTFGSTDNPYDSFRKWE